MSHRKKDGIFEDDGRVIADMSGLGNSKLEFTSSHEFTSSPDFTGPPGNSELPGGAKPGKEPPAFSWRERLHYIGAALGAALLIGFAFMAGLGIVIWLITLYGLN